MYNSKLNWTIIECLNTAGILVQVLEICKTILTYRRSSIASDKVKLFGNPTFNVDTGHVTVADPEMQKADPWIDNATYQNCRSATDKMGDEEAIYANCDGIYLEWNRNIQVTSIHCVNTMWTWHFSRVESVYSFEQICI